jgi:muramoyltetrapeptide carboxypeptidase
MSSALNLKDSMKIKLKKRLKPRRLQQGDAVGIVAPAGHFDTETFKRGIAVLESMGFVPVFDRHLFEKDGTFAGTDSHRAAQVNRFFSDPEIKAVFCARGGYGAIRILSRLDFERIRKNPKSLIGFSDITALHAAIALRCNLVTLHGPTVTTLATATEKARTSFYSVIATDHIPAIRPRLGLTLQGGSGQGPVSGGNLTTLCHLVGTPFQPDLDGCIVFFEDIGEAEYRIDRMLTQMKLAGCFDGVMGVALGNFRRCGKRERIDNIFFETFKEYGIPILSGFTIGHQKSSLTIPLGATATLDADRKMLVYHEPATR